MKNRISRGALAEKLGRARRVCLVRGGTSFEASGAAALLAPMVAGVETDVWIVESADPCLDEVEGLASLIRYSSPDVCVAVGGGRVIDSAKAAAFLARQRRPLVDFLDDASITGVPRQEELIAIPTTAGTGCEVTHFAVVYMDSKKHSLARPDVMPDFCYLDPDLTQSLSAEQVASTGLDALCQAIESLWSLSCTAESRGFAERSLRLASRNLRSAVFAPTRLTRAAMILAAHYSGLAINVTKTTAPHALSYGIRQATGLAHGFAVILTLPELLRTTTDQIAQCGAPVDISWLRFLKRDGHDRAVSFLEDLRSDLVALSQPHEWDRGEIEQMTRRIVAGVNHERLLNHPVSLSLAEMATAVSAGLESINLRS